MSSQTVRRGFTLVELLVVITIIGVLVALLLPAIQSAREAARRVQCTNHVRQLALGAINHLEVHGHYPTGGWTWGFVGDADRGFGREQPGGWVYNILPFLEETNLHALTADGRPQEITLEQRQGAAQLIATPVAVMYCPSRRPPVATGYDYEGHERLGIRYNWNAPDISGKVDYAINGGDTIGGAYHSAFLVDPWCYDELGNVTCDGSYTGPHSGNISPLTGGRSLSGVSFGKSEIRLRHVSDGTTHTYLIGEKNLSTTMSELIGDFIGAGEGRVWPAGITHIRSAYFPPVHDSPEVENGSFGGPHRGGFPMAHCDGSVRVIDFDVDLVVFQAGANRMDGLGPVPMRPQQPTRPGRPPRPGWPPQ